jgi:hypothetical protein
VCTRSKHALREFYPSRRRKKTWEGEEEEEAAFNNDVGIKRLYALRGLFLFFFFFFLYRKFSDRTVRI